VPSDFARTFFKLEGKRTNHFYESTRIEDYAFKTTTPQPGESLDYGSATRKYVHWLIKAAHKDASVGSVFWESTNATRKNLFKERRAHADLTNRPSHRCLCASNALGCLEGFCIGLIARVRLLKLLHGIIRMLASRLLYLGCNNKKLGE
jgi:hypothetical protein